MKKIIILMLVVMATLSVSAQTKPLTCKGVSKSGNACKSTIVSKNTGFCNAHNPNRTKCSGKNTQGKPCNMTVTKGKTTCRFHGV